MRTGVSVVIPSFRGAAAIGRTTASLSRQTLDPTRFEVVLVVNGPAAADHDAFDAMRAAHPRLRIRLVATSTAGASLAWNVAVQAARMEWLTFVDDDDIVTPTYLSALVDLAEPGVVPLAEIHDVHEDGVIDTRTALNTRITSHAGTRVAASRLPQALGFNASKLIPTRWAQSAAYDRRMTNGQDVAYFATLSLEHDITFSVVETHSGAAYLRASSGESMSRQAASFDFSIEQRLHVIERIDRVRRRSRLRRCAAADHLVRAQIHLMNRFLLERPERRGDAVAAVAKRRLAWFPYADLNRDLATRLVVVDDALAVSRRIRDRLSRVVSTSDDPVDVLAIARERPARSWVTDFWAEHGTPSAEGRLIQAAPPANGAAARLAESGYHEVVCLARSRAGRAVAAGIVRGNR